MGSPYIGEIRMFGGNFAPSGWAFCNGSLLPIDQNTALFQLIGTTYGGDGQTNFALPNLQGRAPVHVGSGFSLGQMGGVETVTLATAQLPSHSHAVRTAAATQGGAVAIPTSTTVLADEGFNPTPGTKPFTYLPYDGTNQTSLAPNSIAQTGGGQPHDNMQPFLAINFIISLFGIFPSQN
jgi:microcystin-dependent protein